MGNRGENPPLQGGHMSNDSTVIDAARNDLFSGPGRPQKSDRAQSRTVSLLESEWTTLEKLAPNGAATRAAQQIIRNYLQSLAQ